MQRRGFPFAPSSSLVGGNRWASTLTYPDTVGLLGPLQFSYAKMYRTQPWVYAAVRKRANAIGMLPIKVYRPSEEEGEKERVRDGSLIALLDRPNPDWTPTPTEFKRYWSSSLDIYGNFLAVKTAPTTELADRMPGAPSELWPVPWWRVEVVEGDREPVAFYVVRTDDGKPYPFLPTEVIHDAYYSPDSPVGVSPLEPLRRTLAIEDAASRETLASFANASRPAGVFVTEGRALSPDQADAIRRQLHEEYGGVDNAYRVAVLGGGLKWQPTQFTHQETELIPVRKLMREEVAAAFGIDPTQLGILDRATFSNVTEAHRSFYMDNILPTTVQMEETLEAQLLAPEPEWADLDLEFDMAEVLKADIKSRAEAYATLIRVGLKPNEIRHYENLPPIEGQWADSGYIARELMPLDDGLQQEFTDNRSVADDAVAALASALGAIEQRAPAEPADVTVNLPEVKLPDNVRVDVPTPQVHVNQLGVIQAVDAMAKRLERTERAIQEQSKATAEAIAEALRPKVRKVIRDENSNIVSIVEEAG